MVFDLIVNVGQSEQQFHLHLAVLTAHAELPGLLQVGDAPPDVSFGQLHHAHLRASQTLAFPVVSAQRQRQCLLQPRACIALFLRVGLHPPVHNRR